MPAGPQLGRRAPLVHHTTGKKTHHTTSTMNANANALLKKKAGLPSTRSPTKTTRILATHKTTTTTKPKKTVAAPKPAATTKTKTTAAAPKPVATTKTKTTAAAPKPTTTTRTVKGAGNSSSSTKRSSTSHTKSTSPNAAPKPTTTTQTVKGAGNSSSSSGTPKPTSSPSSKTTSTTSAASAPGYTGVPPGPGAYLYSNPSQLAEPQVLMSVNGLLDITLTVKVARHTDFISFNSRQYSCNGITAIPGPTWNITAGDTVTVTIVNQLGANNDADDLVDMTLMNTMHSPNSTNLHTHGLHVSSSQDNVFQRIYPGETFQYKYTIPEDHAPGLHWYHSHKHGTSALQVMGGLVGAIYVRPTEAAVTKSAALTYLASLERHCSSWRSISQWRVSIQTPTQFTVRTYEYLSNLLKSQVPINAEYTNSSVKDVYFINGQFQPQLAMTPGTPVVLDMVNAVGDVNIELDIRDSPQASSVSSSCSLVQIASDGIYFTSVRTLGYVAMVPGNRVSIIIQCTKPGTYYLTNVPDDSLRPGLTDNETRFQQSMVTLVVGGTEATAFTSYDSLDLSTITRPVQLKDTLNTVVTSKWELSVEQEPATTRGMTWLGMGSNCSITSTGRGSDGTATPASSNTNCQYLSFPGELSTSGPYRHITYVGAVDELTINGRGKSPHSVHIHVNHFQVISDGLRGDAQRYFYRIGDWRDTIPAFPGKVKVRQNVQDFSGEVVVHCHFLMHEDMGMMATYYVRPANESSKGYCTYPGGTATTAGSCALSDGVVLSSATLSAVAVKTNSPVT
ncbi:Cupredoxin [Chytriomyces cf. hyalinus JEL632]|nr:Cupredoxin [Chytriomyces cf. hyalinus JEL632]